MVHLAISLLFLFGVQAEEKGFTPIFNGKDLAGIKFQLESKEADPAKTFSVKGGMIACTVSPNGYWYTVRSYKEFTLRFDWCYERPADLKNDEDFKGNSGYLLFIEKHEVWPRSLEVQGMNRDVGAIIPIQFTKKPTIETDAAARKKARKPVGEWNAMEIASKGGKITVKLNGALISTVTECELKEGPIGFQSEGAEIHWRNVRIREE